MQYSLFISVFVDGIKKFILWIRYMPHIYFNNNWMFVGKYIALLLLELYDMSKTILSDLKQL